jgi:NTP pyrophosphatase (non-canonical NTP hydrolase)
MIDTVGLVEKWAEDRELLDKDPKVQILKTFSEMGELSDALIKRDMMGIVDGIGDVLVTLIILARQEGLHVEDCLNHAYNEIKDRTGRTVNGTFIKD